MLPEGEIKFSIGEITGSRLSAKKRKVPKKLAAGGAKGECPRRAADVHQCGEKFRHPVLEGLISKTKFAISMKESRSTLNGGLMILKPDTLAR